MSIFIGFLSIIHKSCKCGNCISFISLQNLNLTFSCTGKKYYLIMTAGLGKLINIVTEKNEHATQCEFL